MRERCPICRDQGFIRFPLWHEMSQAAPLLDTLSSGVNAVSYKEYPCPECTPKTSLEHVDVFTATVRVVVDSRYEQYPGFQEAARSQAAHDLVEFILRKGYVQLVRCKTDSNDLSYSLEASLGVVSPQVIATLEQRIAERQEAVAREVAAKAAELIQEWGSFYGQTTLLKTQALDSLQEALKRVVHKHQPGKKVVG